MFAIVQAFVNQKVSIPCFVVCNIGVQYMGFTVYSHVSFPHSCCCNLLVHVIVCFRFLEFGCTIENCPL